VKPEKIDPDAPLIREGLGLYSNDAFEQPLALFKKCAFKLSSDNKQNSIIFRSLRALSRHVKQSLAQ
jgi:acyl carrier protein